MWEFKKAVNNKANDEYKMTFIKVHQSITRVLQFIREKDINVTFSIDKNTHKWSSYSAGIIICIAGCTTAKSALSHKTEKSFKIIPVSTKRFRSFPKLNHLFPGTSAGPTTVQRNVFQLSGQDISVQSLPVLLVSTWVLSGHLSRVYPTFAPTCWDRLQPFCDPYRGKR